MLAFICSDTRYGSRRSQLTQVIAARAGASVDVGALRVEADGGAAHHACSFAVRWRDGHRPMPPSLAIEIG